MVTFVLFEISLDNLEDKDDKDDQISGKGIMNKFGDREGRGRDGVGWREREAGREIRNMEAREHMPHNDWKLTR